MRTTLHGNSTEGFLLKNLYCLECRVVTGNYNFPLTFLRLERSNNNIQSPVAGGGVVLVSDKLIISTQLGGALQMSNFVTCLYRTVLEVN